MRQAKLAQREFEDKVRRLEKQLSQVQDQGSAGRSRVGAVERRLQGRRSRRHDEAVEEVLQKRYEVSAGKARVAKDMVDMDEVEEKENERKALEQVALAEFLASQGIQSSPAPAQSTPSAAKEIGPEQ